MAGFLIKEDYVKALNWLLNVYYFVQNTISYFHSICSRATRLLFMPIAIFQRAIQIVICIYGGLVALLTTSLINDSIPRWIAYFPSLLYDAKTTIINVKDSLTLSGFKKALADFLVLLTNWAISSLLRLFNWLVASLGLVELKEQVDFALGILSLPLRFVSGFVKNRLLIPPLRKALILLDGETDEPDGRRDINCIQTNSGPDEGISAKIGFASDEDRDKHEFVFKMSINFPKKRRGSSKIYEVGHDYNFM